MGIGQYLMLSPEGHYKATPDIERDLVYVVHTDQGQETLTPEEFSRRYGWKNDPSRVRLSLDGRKEVLLSTPSETAPPAFPRDTLDDVFRTTAPTRPDSAASEHLGPTSGSPKHATDDPFE